MDKNQITNVLEIFKTALIKKYGDKIELFLFGSAARGDFTGDFDFDVLIVFDGVVDNSL